jgi:hypothetical protein
VNNKIKKNKIKNKKKSILKELEEAKEILNRIGSRNLVLLLLLIIIIINYYYYIYYYY